MKKVISILTFTLLITGASFAQDSTNGMAKQHHTMATHKSMHHSNSLDSSGTGSMTTNHSGKMHSNSGTQMKSPKKRMSTSSKMSADSTK